MNLCTSCTYCCREYFVSSCETGKVLKKRMQNKVLHAGYVHQVHKYTYQKEYLSKTIYKLAKMVKNRAFLVKRCTYMNLYKGLSAALAWRPVFKCTCVYLPFWKYTEVHWVNELRLPRRKSIRLATHDEKASSGRVTKRGDCRAGKASGSQ